MADKLSQQITDALSRAAAEPAGLPLFTSRNEPGLFSTTTKLAAQKAVADGLLQVVHTERKGKQSRELYGLSDSGWEYLLATVNPRQVLEDFVRVLEARETKVEELVGSVQQMAEHLHGLKDAVIRILPSVTKTRIANTQAVESRLQSPSPHGTAPMKGTALLEAPIEIGNDLSEVILARLGDWSGSAGEDCPLPELYRSLSTREPQPTIGEFHDCLRKLHSEGAIYLHSWTGPLYALPEPALALLVGHGVAYYASVR